MNTSRRGLSFYLLAGFFALFVLFLYGPTATILVLSFQGPEGGLTFPMNGVSLHWFRNLFEQQAVGDFGGSFHVGPKDGFLGILFPRVATGVHIDRDECLGGLDDDVTAGRKIASPLEGIADLGLDASHVEQRDTLLVRLDPRNEVGRDGLEILGHLVEDGLRVDRETVHLGAEQVADESTSQAGFTMKK